MTYEQEQFEERAALIEDGCRVTRGEAEAMAREQVQRALFEFRENR